LHFWGQLFLWGFWSDTWLEDDWLVLNTWCWLWSSVHLLGSVWISTFDRKLVDTVADWGSWWSSNGFNLEWCIINWWFSLGKSSFWSSNLGWGSSWSFFGSGFSSRFLLRSFFHSVLGGGNGSWVSGWISWSGIWVWISLSFSVGSFISCLFFSWYVIEDGVEAPSALWGIGHTWSEDLVVASFVSSESGFSHGSSVLCLFISEWWCWW
jgi:hypothetical protein